MILLCDEDVGTSVPAALRAVQYQVHSLVGLRWQGRKDVDWLVTAGSNKWLVFSCNFHMLNIPPERQAILDNRVGIVFFTQQHLRRSEMLRVLLNKWSALEKLDGDVTRPFARFLSPNGRISSSYRDLRL